MQLTLKAIAVAVNVTKRGAELRAAREQWPFNERRTVGGRQRVFQLSELPADIQAAVVLKHAPRLQAPARPDRASPSKQEVSAAIERLRGASASDKETAQQRARALAAVARLVDAGAALLEARRIVAAQMQRENRRGASVASLGRWADRVRGASADAWLGLLLPDYTGGTAHVVCAPQVWDWYKGHFLSRAKPSHADTYARCREMCDAQGWELPSYRTMLRRMDADVDRVTQVLLREGEQAAMRLLPPQKRDASMFGAGEAVNGDGLKFDKLWVRFPDGEILNTTTGWFWQDLRTRRVLAWRICKTENTDLFRLATYDLTAVCAPSHVWIDNTRVAANKLMTAGAENRHRFGSGPDDGLGLLLMLGMEPHFTNPDAVTGNPGAKPIERAFGIGGLHSAVASHPRLIDRGYSKATAIDVGELRDVIIEEVARHNAKTGRRTDACHGTLSFDQAWAAAIAERPARVLSDVQRQLLLMSREVVRCDSRSGMITLKAGRGPHGANQYWSEALLQQAGRKVAVHFDPDALRDDVHIYGIDGRYLCAAQHRPSIAFDSTADGREHGKFKQRARKAMKLVADAQTRMTALERAALYGNAKPAAPAAIDDADPKVVQGHFARVANPERDAQRRTGSDDATVVREMRTDEFMKRIQEQQLKDRL